MVHRPIQRGSHERSEHVILDRLKGTFAKENKNGYDVSYSPDDLRAAASIHERVDTFLAGYARRHRSGNSDIYILSPEEVDSVLENNRDRIKEENYRLRM